MWTLREISARRISVLLKAPQMFTIGYGFTPHKNGAAATPIDIGGTGARICRRL
jgi:hypothetical protein